MTTTPPTVRRLTGRVGAEITEVELGPDLDRDTLTRVREALLAHKVIFFRDQHHLTDETQAGFASLLGPSPLRTPPPERPSGESTTSFPSTPRGAEPTAGTPT